MPNFGPQRMEAETLIFEVQDREVNPQDSKLKDARLTSHVTSRYYRAPELILIEKKYGLEIDMWAIGCVFGELLHTLRSKNNNE